MTTLLGIDLGTSSVKAVVFDVDSSEIVAVSGQEYPILQPKPTYAEQNPQEWWQATIDVVREVCVGTDEIAAIGFSGQMHAPAFLDSNDQSVHPAIIWADQRSAGMVQPLIDAVGPDDFVKIAGTLPATGFMGPTLLWLRDNMPDMLDSVHKLILPKDYIRLQMTGVVATDITDAAATGLFDVSAGIWSDVLIGAVDVSRGLFPVVLGSTDVAGQLMPSAAEALGLKPGIPVIAGSADQPAQAIANSVLRAGQASITVGTGGQVNIPLTVPYGSTVPTDARVHVFNHALPDTYYVLGAILAAGLCLRWLRNTFGLELVPEAYDILSQEAATIPAGAEGLLFLPYLFGERTPHMDPLARGAFVGLTYRHGRGHMARAIMEGVSFALRHTFEVSNRLVQYPIGTLILAGGAGQSAIWRQILTDIFGRPLPVSSLTEQSAVGAALMAGVGCGVYDSLEQAADSVARHDSPPDPISDHVRLYDGLYDEYTGLYDQLKPTFQCLSGI